MDNNDVICTCLDLTIGDIKKAIEDGATTFEEVQQMTDVGNVCGVCIGEVREIVDVCRKIGIKPDAIHKGGINLFGKNFGDYKQSIILKILSSS